MNIKKLLISFAVLALSIGPVADAQTTTSPSPLPEEAERAMLSFVSQLSTPPNIVMTATLQPPRTIYGAELRDPGYDNAIGSLAGNRLFVTTTLPGVTEWTMDISCGTAQNYTEYGETKVIVLGRRVWSHPDGPGGCPHEEGTSHKGTISVAGDYSMNIMWGEEKLLSATWAFTCSYEGSETGTAQCEERVVKWEGRYGSMPEGSSGNGPRTVIVIVITTIVILVGGIAITLKVRRETTEKGGWPGAQTY